MKNMIQTYDEHGEPMEPPKGPESKEYLLLLCYDEDDEGDILEDSYIFVTGRTEAYEKLKEELINNSLDPFNSFVLVENVALQDRLTVACFMEYCKKFFPGDFDLVDLGFSPEAIRLYVSNEMEKEYTADIITDVDDDNTAVLAMDLINNEPDPDDDVEDV